MTSSMRRSKRLNNYDTIRGHGYLAAPHRMAYILDIEAVEINHFEISIARGRSWSCIRRDCAADKRMAQYLFAN